jgi:ElaB/YqjD/DUF883 family membrane-anchored ribosome-binding protein
MNDTTAAQKDKLVADLRQVISDAEDLLRLGAEQTGDRAAEWRTRVEERITQARYKMADLQDNAMQRAKAAGHAADDYVHEHPWKAIGAAAGVGLIVGMLIGRR